MTSIDSENLANLPHVDAPLHYLVPTADKPFVYMYEPPAGMPARSGNQVVHTVPIRDVRPVSQHLSLDREGVLLRRHQSAVSDFYDEDEVRAVYYPEIGRLVQELAGGDRTMMFDHTLRSAARGAAAGAREPVRAVHNDYTLRSGPQRVRDLLEPAEAEVRLAHRFAVIGVWRPIKGPVLDTPLAVCDAWSIAPRELVPVEMRYPDRNGETYALTYSPDHRWFYAPRMQPDEVLVFKGYDSAADGRARFTAHTGFDDPTAPAGAAPRESIEARLLVFFAPE